MVESSDGVAVAGGEPLPGNGHKGLQGGVEQHRPGCWELGDVFHPASGVHGSSGAGELAQECVDEASTPSFHERPPPGVSDDGEKDAEGSRERCVEREHGVCADPGQEALGLVGREPPDEVGDRRHSSHCEAGHGDRVTRGVPERCEHSRDNRRGRLDQRSEQAEVLGAVRAQCGSGVADRAEDRPRTVLIERVGEGHLGPA